MNIQNPTQQNVYDTVCFIRNSKLPNPKEVGNAGSFFKNPEITLTHYQTLNKKFINMPSYPSPKQNMVKVPAGWLIEQAGWKGKTLQNVGVHHKQALVLVNYGMGTGKEILSLAQQIQNSVQVSYNIYLEMEVNVI